MIYSYIVNTLPHFNYKLFIYCLTSKIECIQFFPMMTAAMEQIRYIGKPYSTETGKYF